MKKNIYLSALCIIFFIPAIVDAQTILSGIYEGTTYSLTKAMSPYLVKDSAIFNCSYFAIDPGVIVTFAYHQDPEKKSYMRINGSLDVINTINSEPIIFTSERDNQPFDLNGDGTASRPMPGDWGYVFFDQPGIDQHLQLINGFFRYGGGKKLGDETDPELYPMVTVSDYNSINNTHGPLKFANCSFSNSAGVGIMGGMVNLNQVQIYNCIYGIRMISSDFNIMNCEIRDNIKYPIVLIDPLIKRDGGDDYNSIIDIINNTDMYNNGLDVIALKGHVRCAYDKNSNSPLLNTYLPEIPIPYLIIGDLYIDSLKFNVFPGTVIKFLPESYTGKPLNIYFIKSASLKTNGTANKKVIFTSLFDYKYDKSPPPNQDLIPQAGDWGIISGKNPEISHTLFKYGGKYISSNGEAIPDSSAVINITGADPGKCNINTSVFTNLYANGIFVSESAITSGQTNINDNSFLLDNYYYGITPPNKELATDSLVNATNNYWNGKLGPYHPVKNSSGNGCKVGNYIDFSEYQTSSQAATDLLTSLVRGVVENDQGELLKDAIVMLDSKSPRTAYTNVLGQFYFSDVKAGDGYKLEVMAKAHHEKIISPLNIPQDTSMSFNIVLEKYTIDYRIDTINFNINPAISTVAVGGTAHRYYKIIDIKTEDPVYNAEVIVPEIDTFYTNSKGIVDIAIPSAKVGGANTSRSFYIQRIGIETLDFPADSRVSFDVQVKPYTYHKIWSGSTFFTVGISGFEGKKLNGAAIDLYVKNNGTGEYADSIRMVRQSQTGFGYNLGASAKATVGPAEGGAEAGIGVNMNVLLEDDYKFDYPNSTGRLALSKFIVLADGALPYMDSPLIRYFTVALEKQMSEIDAASISNSVGMNIHAFASANAGLDLNIGPEKTPLGAELKGSASLTGDITYMAKAHSHINPVTDNYPTDLDFHNVVELSLGAEAGVGFDLKKLFSGGETDNSKNGESQPKVDKVKSDLPFPIPDEDLKLELGSANISGGVKFGTHFGTTRFVPDPSCRLGFLYGFKYSYGADFLKLADAGKSQNREFTYNFDFYDEKMVEMVKQTTELATSMLSPQNIIDLNISDLTSGKIFNGPMDKIADLQSRNSFSIAPVPYQKTINDQVGEGGFNIIIDVGAAVVRAKFGAGFNYKENNKYLKENGLFYKWHLYPLESYDFVNENDAYKPGPIIQDIVDKSANYLVDEIKQNLRPPIFRKVHLWSRFFKSASQTQDIIPIGPGSRTSTLSFEDSTGFSSIAGIDSLDVIYWDWYGTGDDSAGHVKTLAPKTKALFDYVKNSAVAAHKLDYGIGGFYQFEPYNTSVGDNKVFVNINYFDDELTVMLPDSSITTISEKDLRMYKEDKENNRWVYIGGEVDTLNNIVSAQIDNFGTFTLAPFVPGGEVKLYASPDTIRIKNTNTTTITSDQIFYNTDEVIADGELFTLKASRGSFQGTDADTLSPGFQVAASGGTIKAIYQTNDLSGNVYVTAESNKGDAFGKVEIVITDTIAPSKPVLSGVELQDENVHLWWKNNNETDIVKYLVQYDTISGGPYKGVASVFGEPSPVNAGLDSTLNISGLDRNKTYYFAITAVDRSGNISPYSNELSIKTVFNYKPIFYHKIIHIKPDLANGTVVDTLKATDEDLGQILVFYFASTNTEDAFALDPETGILTVKNQERLNYFVTRIDTFLLNIGVRDNAVNPASDEGLVMVVLDVDIATWMPKYSSKQNSKLELYPNPAREYITLKVGDSGYSDEIKVNIYTISGKNCYSSSFHNINRNELKIPVRFLDAGYYIIELQTKTKKRVASFAIMK